MPTEGIPKKTPESKEDRMKRVLAQLEIARTSLNEGELHANPQVIAAIEAMSDAIRLLEDTQKAQ